MMMWFRCPKCGLQLTPTSFNSQSCRRCGWEHKQKQQETKQGEKK